MIVMYMELFLVMVQCQIPQIVVDIFRCIQQTKNILIGIVLLILLPFSAKLSYHFQQEGYETCVVGNYSERGQNETTLKILANKTYEHFKNEKKLIKLFSLINK